MRVHCVAAKPANGAFPPLRRSAPVPLPAPMALVTDLPQSRSRRPKNGFGLLHFVLRIGTSMFLLSNAAFAGEAMPVGNSRTPVEGATETSDKNRSTTDIVVTGRRLDIARDSIAPSLGASDYNFNRAALDKEPGGGNVELDEVLLQAPGVTRDGYGEIHVRNEHGNLQYRLNGVIVPESVSTFGDTFDQRIASSIDLLTGTLPAQYGYRTSGVINLKTQSGAFANGGEIGVYGGSRNTLQPNAMIQGSSGPIN